MSEILGKLLDKLIEIEFDKLQVYRDMIREEYKKDYSARNEFLPVLLLSERMEQAIVSAFKEKYMEDETILDELEIMIRQKADAYCHDDCISGLIFQDEVEIVYKKIYDLIAQLDFEIRNVKLDNNESLEDNSEVSNRLKSIIINNLLRILLMYLEESINNDEYYDLRYYLIRTKYEIIFMNNIIEKEFIHRSTSNQKAPSLTFGDIDLTEDIFLDVYLSVMSLNIFNGQVSEALNDISSSEIEQQLEFFDLYSYDDDITKKSLAAAVIRADFIGACLNFVNPQNYENYQKILEGGVSDEEDEDAYSSDDLRDILERDPVAIPLTEILKLIDTKDIDVPLKKILELEESNMIAIGDLLNVLYIQKSTLDIGKILELADLEGVESHDIWVSEEISNILESILDKQKRNTKKIHYLRLLRKE